MTEQIMRANLSVVVHTFAQARGWSMATVSREIHGNQAFLEGYFSGKRSPTMRTYFNMVGKLRDRWPEGAEWPDTLPVPKLGKKVESAPA